MNEKHYTRIKEGILNRIVNVLADVYDETMPDPSHQNLSAWLAFKGDPYLNELRLALERLEQGEFGKCILCKTEIEFPILKATPTAHFCEKCSTVFHQLAAARQSKTMNETHK